MWGLSTFSPSTFSPLMLSFFFTFNRLRSVCQRSACWRSVPESSKLVQIRFCYWKVVDADTSLCPISSVGPQTAVGVALDVIGWRVLQLFYRHVSMCGILSIPVPLESKKWDTVATIVLLLEELLTLLGTEQSNQHILYYSYLTIELHRYIIGNRVGRINWSVVRGNWRAAGVNISQHQYREDWWIFRVVCWITPKALQTSKGK
jgi:hypothetical protein